MTDRYVEKSFLYLLGLSLLFHAAVYLIITLIPPQQVKTAQEPTMVDLTDLPDLVPPPKQTPRPEPEHLIKRHAEVQRRVTKETAPKGQAEVERIPRTRRPSPPATSPAPRPAAPSPSGAVQTEQAAKAPVARGEGILKPKGTPQVTDRSRLFPSASRLARLEDNYREKYRRDVEEGDTKFLNTDDILFGSFLRRLETAIYGVWHYPQAALLRGIEGTTPVRITFNRNGEITKVEVLESSGSKILDDEVLRALNALGPIGSFPKGYTGENFKLIAFFHYGNGGGRVH